MENNDLWPSARFVTASQQSWMVVIAINTLVARRFYLEIKLTEKNFKEIAGVVECSYFPLGRQTPFGSLNQWSADAEGFPQIPPKADGAPLCYLSLVFAKPLLGQRPAYGC